MYLHWIGLNWPDPSKLLNKEQEAQEKKRAEIDFS